jgi:hypothetical protein
MRFCIGSANIGTFRIVATTILKIFLRISGFWIGAMLAAASTAVAAFQMVLFCKNQ